MFRSSLSSCNCLRRQTLFSIDWVVDLNITVFIFVEEDVVSLPESSFIEIFVATHGVLGLVIISLIVVIAGLCLKCKCVHCLRRGGGEEEEEEEEERPGEYNRVQHEE